MGRLNRTSLGVLSEKCNLCIGKILIERRIVMARPIKETPILFGEDARRFEERMKQKRTEAPEDRKRRLENFKLAISIFKG